MAPHTAASTSPGVAPQSRSFIVYDGTTGAVLHVHHAVEFAVAVPLEEHTARARRAAGAKGSGAVAFLEVSTDRFYQSRPLRVDPHSQAVEWAPHPQRKLKRGPAALQV